MKTNLILLTIGLTFLVIPLLLSHPDKNGTVPGCTGGGCHTLSAGIVSVAIVDFVNIEVTLSGNDGNDVAGELVDETGTVVDVQLPTLSNPFTLTAPDLGDYTVNAGYRRPSAVYDVANVSITELPVELTSFSAVILENGIKLKWRTETEVSNYGFDIERAFSNFQNLIWEKIGFVEGHGNSNSPKNYSFNDMNILAGKYSYRLKQIDTDGQFEFSKVIEIDLDSPMAHELSQNYPNPFNPVTTISFTLPETNSVKLSTYNSLGEKIEELINEVKEAGTHTINFNAERLSSGTYYYTIESNNFTQTKKMILLK
jgi:hypothetical protein